MTHSYKLKVGGTESLRNRLQIKNSVSVLYFSQSFTLLSKLVVRVSEVRWELVPGTITCLKLKTDFLSSRDVPHGRCLDN